MQDEIKLRAGRLKDIERMAILQELGETARERFDYNLVNNSSGYNLRIFRGALQYSPDIENFENAYFIDTGNDELNTIAEYFEYGTGIYNTRFRGRGMIRPRVKQAMKFLAKNGKAVFAKEVKGVRPVFMMRKAVKSVEFDRKELQRQIRINLGI